MLDASLLIISRKICFVKSFFRFFQIFFCSFCYCFRLSCECLCNIPPAFSFVNTFLPFFSVFRPDFRPVSKSILFLFPAKADETVLFSQTALPPIIPTCYRLRVTPHPSAFGCHLPRRGRQKTSPISSPLPLTLTFFTAIPIRQAVPR